jgi:hydrogenase maturation protease
MKKIIIIGYGNPDREDDGVAWHVVMALAGHFGVPVPVDLLDGFVPVGSNPDFYTSLQLTPEMADTIAEYDAVCFVDAHTGAVPDDLNIKQLEPGFQNSPFTHHMTPETCLSITQTIYQKEPVALLVSVRGYSFEFSRSLSPRTAALAEDAVKMITIWVDELLDK